MDNIMPVLEVRARRVGGSNYQVPVEVVKIDPKSIGVGQYQHDVSQKKLSENLDFVVDTDTLIFLSS